MQSMRSGSHGSSNRRGRPLRRRGSESRNRSPLAENRDASPTDHVYSSRSQMERARERESEREATPTVQGRQSGAQRRQASRSSRDQRKDAERRSREGSSDDDRDLETNLRESEIRFPGFWGGILRGRVGLELGVMMWRCIDRGGGGS